MKKCILVLLVLSIMSGYAAGLSARRRTNSADNQPEWLTNPHSRYPETQYLVAIGEGDNRSRAENNASANLSRIFETVVEVEDIYQERYRELVSGEEAFAETFVDTEQYVRLTSGQTLLNVQFGESYTDNLGRVYVVAYIDRLRTGDIYLERINQNNERVVFYLNKLSESYDPINRYAYASAAYVISTANQSLIEQLEIISSVYRSMVNLGYDHNALQHQTVSLARELNFNISLKNDSGNKLKSVLSEVLTDIGFTVSDEGSLLISGEVLIEDVDLQRQEKFVRWNLNLNMQDSEERTLLTHSQRGREGHLNRSEAEARAFREMEREIRHDFSKKMFGFFDNQVR